MTDDRDTIVYGEAEEMNAETTIIEALRSRQSELGLSHRQFAKRLGVSVTLWIETIRPEGHRLKRHLNPKLAAAARNEDPELEGWVNQFLTRTYPARKFTAGKAA